MGSCALLAGKSVAFAGWCSGWVKIGTTLSSYGCIAYVERASAQTGGRGSA